MLKRPKPLENIQQKSRKFIFFFIVNSFEIGSRFIVRQRLQIDAFKKVKMYKEDGLQQQYICTVGIYIISIVFIFL